MQFKVWPIELEDVESLTKKISLTNETPADLIFKVAASGPFELVGTNTNAPAHPLSKSSTVGNLFNVLNSFRCKENWSCNFIQSSSRIVFGCHVQDDKTKSK